MKKLWIIALIMAFTAPAGMALAQSSTPKLWNSNPRENRPNDIKGGTPGKKSESNVAKQKNSNSSGSGGPAIANTNGNSNTKSESPLRPVNVNKNFKAHARNVAQKCINSWESDNCLTATSEAAMVLISQYGAKLQNANFDEQKEKLKQECAASTAASQKSGFPAYAMKSAYTTCANTIYDIQVNTSIGPDADYYQLLVGTILCMNGNVQCGEIENGLKKTLL